MPRPSDARKSAAKKRASGNGAGGSGSRLNQRRVVAQKVINHKYEAKRQKLVECAAAAFREKGYEATTLADIADRFGSDRASLYYYASGKEELLHEALKGALDKHLEEAEDILVSEVSAPEKISLLIQRQMATQEDNYPYMYLYIQEDMHKMFRGKRTWARRMASQMHRYEEIVLLIIQSGVDEGTVRSDLPVRLLANAVFGMTNWAHRWFKPERPYSAAEVAEVFGLVFLDGVKQPG